MSTDPNFTRERSTHLADVFGVHDIELVFLGDVEVEAFAQKRLARDTDHPARMAADPLESFEVIEDEPVLLVGLRETEAGIKDDLWVPVGLKETDELFEEESILGRGNVIDVSARTLSRRSEVVAEHILMTWVHLKKLINVMVELSGNVVPDEFLKVRGHLKDRLRVVGIDGDEDVE